MIIGLVLITVSCAQINGPSELDKTYVAPYNPATQIITKIGIGNIDDPTPKDNSPSRVNINIHVINAANGKSIMGAEISANGIYFGNTDNSGNYLLLAVELGKSYNFTIYQGQYLTSHEIHVIDGNDFTSMLTRIQ